VADNRTSEVGLDWDTDALSNLLAAGLDTDGLFSEEELAEVLAANTLPGEFPEYDESAADSVQYCECPNCGHKFPK
jgi:hypothetical protein